MSNQGLGSGLGQKKPDPGFYTPNEGRFLKVLSHEYFRSFKAFFLVFILLVHKSIKTKRLKNLLSLRYKAPDPVFCQNWILIPGQNMGLIICRSPVSMSFKTGSQNEMFFIFHQSWKKPVFFLKGHWVGVFLGGFFGFFGFFF